MPCVATNTTMLSISEDPASKCLSWPQCERAGLVSQVLIRVYPFDVVPDWRVSSSINMLIKYVACEMPCYSFGAVYLWLSSKIHLLLCKSIPQHDILPQIQGYYSTYSSFIIHCCARTAFSHWWKEHHENHKDCIIQRWWNIQSKEMLTIKSQKRLIACLDASD